MIKHASTQSQDLVEESVIHEIKPEVESGVTYRLCEFKFLAEHVTLKGHVQEQPKTKPYYDRQRGNLF